MQIKSTVRYHLMPVRMIIIKMSRNNRYWQSCGEIGTVLPCWWECKLVQPLWKMMWWFLKDLEPEILFDPAVALLGIYPKDYKSFYYKDTCTRVFIVDYYIVYCSTVYNSKDLEPTQMSINNRLDKENVHKYRGILCSLKKWDHVLCRDIDEAGSHHSQQTNTGTENQMPHVLTDKWKLNTEYTWTERRQQQTAQSTRWWGMGERRGLKTYLSSTMVITWVTK